MTKWQFKSIIINSYLLSLQELKTVEKIEAQLEKEQEAALEEATEEEQSYLKEIEREKNTEIIVDTEPETDGELGVSLSEVYKAHISL